MFKNHLVVAISFLLLLPMVFLSHCYAGLAADTVRLDAIRPILHHVLRRCGEASSARRCRWTVGVPTRESGNQLHEKIAELERQAGTYHHLEMEHFRETVESSFEVDRFFRSWWTRKSILEGSACAQFGIDETFMRLEFTAVPSRSAGGWNLQTLKTTGLCS